jgi:cation transport ATPase
MIVAILLLTKKIENTVVKKVTSSILSQLQTGQKSVQVWKANGWQSADVAQIRRGDRLSVRTDEIVPFDGRLTTASARVNAHLLNGENHPQPLNEGDDLFAGVIALTDLEMTVSQPLGFRRIDTWAETALAGHTRTSLSPYTRFFSRVEGTLTGVALGGASLLAALAWYQGAGAGHVAESFFIGVLVFCPCLFASILPLTKQLVHLGLLHAGIVTSRSEALLDLCHIRNFYFDKTGTLEAVKTAYQGFQDHDVVSVASLREISKRSVHPLLRELSFSEAPGNADSSPLEKFEEIPGQGVVATMASGDTIVIGRRDHLQKHGVRLVGSSSAWDRDFPGVALNGQLVGQILVKKTYDEKSKRFLQQLTKVLPGTRIQILSGDSGADAGRELATACEGISYHGSMTPEQKAAAIPSASAFVGDGLNDTLALAKADVSFRLGQRAAGFAPVDFHLQVPNLDLLFRVIQYGRKYRRILWQTAGAAFIYNIIAITLAALGFFSPIGAVLAMLGSFTILLLSSLRLWKVDEVHT